MSIKKEKVKVYDMTCTSCEARVEKAIKKFEGVKGVMASFSGQSAIVEYDTDYCDSKMIKEAIKKAGYSTEDSKAFNITGIIIIVAAILLLGTNTGGFDMNSKLKNASYLVLFFVGILTSIHCVGMCGGIMLSQSISKEKTSGLDALRPALLYNAGRVTAYTILGGIVGALGSLLSLTLGTKAALQMIAGAFMIIMGLNMSGFSLFRKINIRLPWSSYSVKRKPKTPFFIGMLNGLMPCGPLQTMQLFALGTGSAFKGALSMFFFALGTVPLMLTFGAVSGLLSKNNTNKLLKFSGILVVVLGLVMGSRGLALAGVNLPTINLNKQGVAFASGSPSGNAAKAVIKDGVQTITMTADEKGYTPNGFYVQKNVPVKWVIEGKGLNSCNGQVVIPSLNKQVQLNQGENVVQFTPGDKDISFSCWMGMIRGVIKVVDNIDSVDTSKSDPSIPAPSSGMSCCTGGGSSPSQQKQSIYGNDISNVKTDRLVRRALISGNFQTAKIAGKGYELEPLISVINKGIKTKLSIDLTSFDNPEGKFTILDVNSGETLTEFNGKKGIVNVEFKIDKDGGYAIVKDNAALHIIEVTDNAKTADLDEIRLKYISQ